MNIVDAVYAPGPPILYLPLHAANPGYDVISGTTHTATAIGSAAGPISGNVASFNGTSSKITVANFSDLINGKRALTFVWLYYVAATSPGHRYIFDSDFTGGAQMAFAYLQAGTQDCRYFARSAAADSSAQRTADFDLAAWGAMICKTNAEGRVQYIKSTTEEQVVAFSPTSQTFSWDTGRTLHIGSDRGSGNWYDGRLAHFAVYDFDVPLSHAAAMAAADAEGVYCNIDLGVGNYQIDGVDVTTASGWQYSLRNTGPNGTLYEQGADFSVVSGASPKTFFLPGAGNYFLSLRETSGGKSHAEQVPLVAA